MKAENKEKNKKAIAKGKVKWFSNQKGYGFITTDEGADIFVHHSAIKGEDDKLLEVGQEVEFEIEHSYSGHGAKAGLMTEKHIKGHIIHSEMEESMESVIEGLVSELTPEEAAAIWKTGMEIKEKLAIMDKKVDNICSSYDRTHSLVEGLMKKAREYGYRV